MKTKFIPGAMIALLLGTLAPAYLGAAEKAEADIESVTLVKGAVIATIGGEPTEATNEITLRRDILIETNGTYKVAGGKQRVLTEGQILDKNGMLTSRDGSIIPVDDHVTTKAGRVILYKDGAVQPVTGFVTLKNGTRVYPDGRMVTTRNVISRLLDGQIIKLTESDVESTDTARLVKGKVILYKDGGRIELKAGQVMAMSDGSKVSASGVVIKKDGSKVSLKEGELFKFSGAGDTR